MIFWSRYYPFITLLFILTTTNYFSLKTTAQEADAGLWHDKERTLHYKPSGTDFILYQGNRRFNRALYGSNTGFRVEAGDLPEFAMYMPGMGGNCKIGIINRNQSKWIIEADTVKTVYRPGSMLYIIKDSLLQKGTITVSALAMAGADGMILKLETDNLPKDVRIVIIYGGATGKKFSRDGDIGADPESSFYLQSAYCKDNYYKVNQNTFQLQYGFTKPLSDDERYEIQNSKSPDTAKKDKGNFISGSFPTNSIVKIVNAAKQETPLKLWQTVPTATPAIAALLMPAVNGTFYFLVEKNNAAHPYKNLPGLFVKAEAARAKIANRITLETPDEYINPLGGALAIAADAIWENPTYLHGAVAWRMRLPAWRGAYVADALGWHDRARTHFDSYLKSQITGIPPGPVMPDTMLHLARQLEKTGTSMFSNGYICRNPDGDIRPHHYDMNLVFMDQLLTHFNYTGDIDYIKKVWPNIKLHLQWEKRNFDADNDGLYDAYACIWASDALQYSGGGVTHSSAYNYRANKMEAQLACLIGEDGSPYQNEAAKILKAMNSLLWLENKGVFAENKDREGLQLTHTAPGLWTIYHAIDEGTSSPLQNFRMMRYIDNHIPHIPVKAKGLPQDSLFLLSTTNWQPYTWSINNVALAENLHTSLAYWQSGENNNAYQLWKSSLIESMYLGASPGNFEQLSFYDAARGELYRDFADPIGMAARTLTEGLFGILPDALNHTLYIKPGFPDHWRFAKLSTPDITIAYKEEEQASVYEISQRYIAKMNLVLQISVKKDNISEVYVNDKKANYKWIENAMYTPKIEINAGNESHYLIRVKWSGRDIEKTDPVMQSSKEEKLQLNFSEAKITGIDDPQKAFKLSGQTANGISAAAVLAGDDYMLINLQQGAARWTLPVSINVYTDVTVDAVDQTDQRSMQLSVINRSSHSKTGILFINDFSRQININARQTSRLTVPVEYLARGTNQVRIKWNDGNTTLQNVYCWNVPASGKYEMVDIHDILNDNVINTFRHRYLDPRPAVTTLQIPWQGIGNWCYPLVQPEISDAGIKNKSTIHLDKIPFQLGNEKNIAYTSQWKNFPQSVNIPLSGKSGHAWFLMAGTTNHQQSQMVNGIIYIQYKDGTKDSLPLINPENWWPIEQDYINDGYAFKCGAKPYRLIFKTGEITRDYTHYSSIKGFSNMGIEGGAGTVLDIPLNNTKELKSLTLKTITNEVLIGLMSLTLER